MRARIIAPTSLAREYRDYLAAIVNRYDESPGTGTTDSE
jgi:hypothetical protein